MTETAIPDTQNDLEPEPIPILEPEEVPEFSKPPFMVAGATFYAQTDRGEFAVPLSLSTKLIRNMPLGLDQLSALWYILGATDSRPQVEDANGEVRNTPKQDFIDELDVVESRLIAAKYFQAFNERQDARLGESRRSSRS